jgi:hypothetical protein
MPTLTATFIITTIPNQQVGVPFTVSGVITYSPPTWTDQLVYEDNSGAQVPIAAPNVNLSPSSFSFTHPGFAAGSHYVTVRDPLTGAVQASNTFNVVAAKTIVANTPTGVVAGTAFTFSGTLTGYTAIPTLTYQIGSATPVVMTGVTGTGWSTAITIAVAGTYSIIVSDGQITSSPVTVVVSPVTTTYVITPIVPSSVTAGATFAFTGTLSGYTSPPSLTYRVNGGTSLPVTGVTTTGWSMNVVAPSVASSYTILVTDGTTNGTTTLVVVAAAKVITPTPPTGVLAGISFTFTGVLSGYTTIPALTYALNGGAKVAMTGVSVTGWAMAITVPTAGSYTVVVSDGTASSSAVPFTVGVSDSITPNAPTGVVANVSFTFTGVLSGYTVVPALTYALNGGAKVAMTGVTLTGWSMPVTIATAGNYSVVVSDGTINSTPVAFTVVAVSITPNTPTGVVAGTAFTFSGSLTGYTSAPTLRYSINGAASVALGGVTTTGWSTILTIATAGTYAIVVTDAVDVVSGSTTFAVTATVVTKVPVTWNPNDTAGSIALSNGNYTATTTGSTGAYSSPAGVRATIAISTTQIVVGEVTFTTITQDAAVGVSDGSEVLNSIGGTGSTTHSLGAYPSTGTGSQPAQTVYYNNNQLTAGNGVSTVAGGVVSWATNGTNWYFSDAAMRTTAGVSWNNSTTADPVSNVGGLSFAGIGSPYYLAFTSGEGGAAAVLNDGIGAFSTFLAAYVAANPSVVTLSTQSDVAPSKAIKPNTPGGVIVGSSFAFTGSLVGYTTAPTLTYSLNGGTAAVLPGVTATGWSATLTTNVAGTNTIAINDTANGVSANISFNATTSTTQPTITGVTFVPAATIYADSATGTVAGQLNVSSANGTLTGLVFLFSTIANFTTSGPTVIFSQAAVAVGSYPIAVTISATNASNSPQTYNITINVTAQNTSTAPPQAQAVGYNLQTFGSAVTVATAVNSTTSYPELIGGANWAPYTFTGTSWKNIGYTQNADGSVTLNGTGQTFGNGLSTAVAGDANTTTNRLSFTGTAFGGGGYFEATMKSTGTMSFWFNDIETMNGVSVNAGPNPWPGQAAGYGDWVEVDMAEFDTAQSYGIAFHNWYATVGSGTNSGSIFPKVMPSPTPDYTQYHKYGFLWVPATATAQGYGTFYFDGTAVGTLTWNKYNSALGPPPTPAQTTTGGGSTFSVLDTLHAALILGCNSGDTLTISSVNVWQATAANNLVNSVSQATPYFSVDAQTGQILTPSGQPFIPRGIALQTADVIDYGVISNAQGQPLTSLFPDINIVRLAVADFNGLTGIANQNSSYSSASYSAIVNYVNILTNLGIVVAINDHTDSTGANSGGATGDNYTAANGMLPLMTAYYQSLAQGFLGNPYVWFGTRNEPPNNSQGILTAEQVATYNAIRGTGNNTIIEMEQIGGGIPSNFGTNNMGANNPNGLWPDSSYASMTNIVWGPHFYNWVTNYSTSVSVSAAELTLMAQEAQQIPSADGPVVPVVVWEYGIGGLTQDPGGVQSATAVQQSIYGSMAWEYDGQSGANSLTNVTGYNTSPSLTTWGQQVANFIRTGS